MAIAQVKIFYRNCEGAPISDQATTHPNFLASLSATLTTALSLTVLHDQRPKIAASDSSLWIRLVSLFQECARDFAHTLPTHICRPTPDIRNPRIFALCKHRLKYSSCHGKLRDVIALHCRVKSFILDGTGVGCKEQQPRTKKSVNEHQTFQADP
jgi:hypothetical protein